MKTSQELEVELIALGDTAVKIAKALKAKGIKGKRFNSCRCPLSVYLSKITGELMSVGLFDAGFAISNGRPTCTVPTACNSFIKKFDSGKSFVYLLETT